MVPVSSASRAALAARLAALCAAGACVAVLCAGVARAASTPPEPAGAAARHASARAIAHYLEARRLAREGEPERAAAELRRAVTHDLTSAELRVALAEALADAGRIDDAAAEVGRALELDREGPTASEALVLLGRIEAARGQREAALLALRKAARLESAAREAGGEADPAPWRLLAQLYGEAGDDDAAARALEELARNVPGDGSGFRELGRAALERRDPARAERHLRRAAELDARDAEVHRLLAAAHEALGRGAEAREDHLAVIARDPDDAGSPLALGRLAAEAGDPAAAREWFDRHVRAAADPAGAQVRVAFAWLEAERGAEALEAARAPSPGAGAETDPRLRLAEGLALQALRRWAESVAPLEAVPPAAGDLFVSARVALAEALSRGGRHAEAQRALSAPLAARPGDVRLVAARAAALELAGKRGEAERVLRAAAEEKRRAGLDADAADLAAALGETLVRAGRAGDAVVALRAALAARPRDEALLYALGYAHDQAGQVEAALAQMRALLALNPDHAEALNFVAYVYAERGERLDEAERLVRRALELRPRSGHVLDSLGWILHRRGEHGRAVEVLERAAALSRGDAVVLEHLGDALRAAARPADAAVAYRRALAVEPEPLAPEEAGRRAGVERKLRELSPGVQAPAGAPSVGLTPAASGR